MSAHSRRLRPLAAALGLALQALVAAGTAHAATITVTTVDDGSIQGDCTLRDAILAANTDAAQQQCSAGDPDTTAIDEIVFAPGVSGVIGLTGGQLELTESLHITGPGADQLTIDAQSQSRIFYINTDADNTTRLTGLTLTGGRTAATDFAGNGGAVYSLGELELVDSVVTGNSTSLDSSPGGGLFVGVHISLLRSKVIGNWTEGYGSNGGGITVPIGRVTITDSTIADNWTEGDTSGAGGLLMLFPFNAATITNSTISGNTTYGANSQAGGLAIGGDTTIVNSTISGNSTQGPDGDGGGMSLSAALILINSSVVENVSSTGVGAIRLITADSVFSVSNSIIASSDDGSHPLCTRAIDTDGSTGNLLTDASCGTATAIGAAPVAIGDLAMGPLADNGGPTQTHALLAGSVAIDTADAATCSLAAVGNLDQRGAPRPVDGNADGEAVCDVGAYEAGDAGDADTIFTDGFELPASQPQVR